MLTGTSDSQAVADSSGSRGSVQQAPCGGGDGAVGAGAGRGGQPAGVHTPASAAGPRLVSLSPALRRGGSHGLSAAHVEASIGEAAGPEDDDDSADSGGSGGAHASAAAAASPAAGSRGSPLVRGSAAAKRKRWPRNSDPSKHYTDSGRMLKDLTRVEAEALLADPPPGQSAEWHSALLRQANRTPLGPAAPAATPAEATPVGGVAAAAGRQEAAGAAADLSADHPPLVGDKDDPSRNPAPDGRMLACLSHQEALALAVAEPRKSGGLSRWQRALKKRLGDDLWKELKSPAHPARHSAPDGRTLLALSQAEAAALLAEQPRTPGPASPWLKALRRRAAAAAAQQQQGALQPEGQQPGGGGRDTPALTPLPPSARQSRRASQPEASESYEAEDDDDDAHSSAAAAAAQPDTAGGGTESERRSEPAPRQQQTPRSAGQLPTDHPSLHKTEDGRLLSDLSVKAAQALLAAQPRRLGPPTLWLRALRQQAAWEADGRAALQQRRQSGPQSAEGLPRDHPSLHKTDSGRPLSQLTPEEAKALLAAQPHNGGPPSFWLRALWQQAGLPRFKTKPVGHAPTQGRPTMDRAQHSVTPQSPGAVSAAGQQLQRQQPPPPAAADVVDVAAGVEGRPAAGNAIAGHARAAPGQQPSKADNPAYHKAPDGRRLSELTPTEAAALLAAEAQQPSGVSTNWVRAARFQAANGLPTDHPSVHFTADGRPVAALTPAQAAALLASRPKTTTRSLFSRALKQQALHPPYSGGLAPPAPSDGQRSADQSPAATAPQPPQQQQQPPQQEQQPPQDDQLPTDHPSLHSTDDGRQVSSLTPAEAAVLLLQHPGTRTPFARALKKQAAQPPPPGSGPADSAPSNGEQFGGQSSDATPPRPRQQQRQQDGELHAEHPSRHVAEDGRPLSALSQDEAEALLLAQPRHTGRPSTWLRALRERVGEQRAAVLAPTARQQQEVSRPAKRRRRCLAAERRDSAAESDAESDRDGGDAAADESWEESDAESDRGGGASSAKDESSGDEYIVPRGAGRGAGAAVNVLADEAFAHGGRGGRGRGRGRGRSKGSGSPASAAAGSRKRKASSPASGVSACRLSLSGLRWNGQLNAVCLRQNSRSWLPFYTPRNGANFHRSIFDCCHNCPFCTQGKRRKAQAPGSGQRPGTTAGAAAAAAAAAAAPWDGAPASGGFLLHKQACCSLQ